MPDRTINDITIRTELKSGDAGYLIYLQTALYGKDPGYDFGFEGYVCGTFAEMFENYDPDLDKFWIAEDDRKIVGGIAILVKPEGRAQLRWFILDPEYRGIGLGKKLLTDSLEYCLSIGLKTVFLETTSLQKKAVSMYEKNGFKLVRSNSTQMWGLSFDELTYEWCQAPG